MFFKLSKGLNAPPEHASIHVSPVAGGMPAAGFDSPFYLYFHMEDGPMFDPYRIPGSRSLHERKMATWALLTGETHSSAVHAEVRRRPHRGMLPDVDFSRAVPDHSRPSLVRRIIRLIRPGAKIRLVDTAASGSSNEAVGEMRSTPYIGRNEAGDSGDSEPLGAEVMRSRAA